MSTDAKASDVTARLRAAGSSAEEEARLDLATSEGGASLHAGRLSTDAEMHAELELERPASYPNRARAGFGLLDNGPRLFMEGVYDGIWGSVDVGALNATPTVLLKRGNGLDPKRASALSLVAPPEKRPSITATVENVGTWAMPTNK